MYGTPHWMAPEVIQSIPAGRASDIWSLGCVVVEMVTGQRPWAALGNLDILPLLYKIAQAKSGPPVPSDSISGPCNDFLQQCFKSDPGQRASTDALLEHSFIVGVEVSAAKDKKRIAAKASQLVRGLVKTINSTSVYEVLVCGHGGVGKTSIVVQFVHQHRVEYYSPIEDQRYQKHLCLDQTSVVLDILDPGRQQGVSALFQKVMESAQGFLVVFSVTDRISFERVSYFVQLIRTANSKRQNGVTIILVGNKCDLTDDRVVKADEARLLVQQLKLAAYCETSGSDAAVLNLFMTLVGHLQDNGSASSSSSSQTTTTSETENNNNTNDYLRAKMDPNKKCTIM